MDVNETESKLWVFFPIIHGYKTQINFPFRFQVCVCQPEIRKKKEKRRIFKYIKEFV